MDKVFINDLPLFFTDNIEVELSNKLIEYESEESLMRAIQLLEKGFVRELFLFGPDLKALKREFSALHHYIEAAGGVVKNKKGSILFIYRHGKWDLPKGKMEEDENPRSCAIREVEEECGIHGLTITKELASTYHTFTQDGRRILKRTYWFVMEYRGNESPKPQKEEHITAAVWMNRTKVTKALSNTYNSIKDVIYSLENS